MTGKEQFEKLDNETDPALKTLMWEYGPGIVAEAQQILATNDPVVLRSLLEKNRQYVERKTQEKLAADAVGERVRTSMHRHLRR